MTQRFVQWLDRRYEKRLDQPASRTHRKQEQCALALGMKYEIFSLQVRNSAMPIA